MIDPRTIQSVFDTSISTPELIASQEDFDHSDSKFREDIFTLLPESFGVKVASHYIDLYKSEGRRAANLYMLDVKDDLSGLGVNLAASNDEIIQYAKNAATHCSRLRFSTKSNSSALFALQHFIFSGYKIKPKLLNQKLKSTKRLKKTKALGEELLKADRQVDPRIGVLNRLCDEYWWRRTLRQTHMRNIEKHAIRSGYVSMNHEIYLSDESFKRYTQQRKRNLKVLENCYALNEETGQEFNLKELAEHSLSNPRNRRAELMVRVKGFDELSKELGHSSMFYTITCPSRMHMYKTRKNKKTGKITLYKNPKYNGTTPKEAQTYLAKIWSQIRAKLKRDGINYYGFRVTEAHHDGTPHWHLLIFMKPLHEKAITKTMRDYACREDSKEQGARKHRFKAETIDPKKGSATQYIAKYITKGLDAHGIDEDLYGKDAQDSSQRVRAWASTWGVRQFQQLGGPPVTIYREMRRLKGNDLNGVIAELWKAADSGDWHQFVKALGGPTLDKKDYIVTVAVQWNDKPNRFQEPTGYQIVGVSFGRVVITTRNYQWKIEYRKVAEEEGANRGGSNEGLPPIEGNSNGIDPLLEAFCF